MYGFVLGPRWIAGHVVVVLAVVVMVNFGFWQLRRLDERSAYNERIEDRTALPVAGFTELAAVASARRVEAEQFRRVRVTGRFRADDDVLIGYRSLEGLSGHHVVTPLVLADGTAVLVNRGWVPAHYLEEWPVADARAPAGEVAVMGFVRAPETSGSFGPRDSEERDLLVVSRVDVERIARRLDVELRPLWIQMESPVPGDGVPAPVPLPDLTDGNHLSYAVQWFIFSAGAAAGWIILLRISGRRRALASEASTHENERASAPV